MKVKQLILFFGFLGLLGHGALANEKNKELHAAVEADDFVTVTRLITLECVDVNAPDDTVYLSTPLHNAVSVRMVRLLLLFGSNVNALDALLLTPLHLACWHFENEIAMELLKNGADAKLKDESGDTAFDCTTQFCPPELRDWLRCSQVIE